MTEPQPTQDIVYALATSPDFAQDGVCFAARDSGLYRSTDGGQTWHPAYQSLNLSEALITMTVAVSPNFAQDQTVFAGVPGGILTSTDGGQAWRITQLPDPPPVVISLAVSPHYAQDNTVLAGTLEDGVFLSTTSGQRWVLWNFGLLDTHILRVVLSPNFAQDKTVFAATETGIFRSTNGGKSWRPTEFPADAAPVLSLASSPGYADDGILLAGTEAHGLFQSTDGGNSWICLKETDSAVNEIILSPVFPAKPDVLLLLDDTLQLSVDKGQTWREPKTSLNLTQGMISFVAPQGPDAEPFLLAGLSTGEVTAGKLLT